MAAPFDLVVRGGTVIDGSGTDPFVADVAVVGAHIAAVGRRLGSGREEIDATDRLVTPGFVDVHTHYDGQVTWSDDLTPSTWNGVTTVVTGNCGVGFAPCRPGDRESLIELMSGIEDLPEPVLAAGVPWSWETFDGYLGFLERRSFDADVCALVPHAPVRVFAMGERALRGERATEEDRRAMHLLVGGAVRAGAFGVSTTLMPHHVSSRGVSSPSIAADEAELVELASGVGTAGRGVVEVVMDFGDGRNAGHLDRFRLLPKLAAAANRPVLFSLVKRNVDPPEIVVDLREAAAAATRQGHVVRPVVAPRAIGLILGHRTSYHPFSGTRTYRSLRDLPLPERLGALRDPVVKARILADDPAELSPYPLLQRLRWEHTFPVSETIDYAPPPGDSFAARGARERRDPREVAYDHLLRDDGTAFIYAAVANFDEDDLATSESMLADPNTLVGLGDGGAHVGLIQDANFPTFLLGYWGRQRERFRCEDLVRRLTLDGASVMGLTDRGMVRPGLRADLNVIDWDEIGFGPLHPVADLPGGGQRLMQRTRGIDVTVVAGRPTYRGGEPTGARPGRLVRSGVVSSAAGTMARPTREV
ncbi:MAG: amidohydrolase family protein [Acidimicrobiia bacterium]